MELLIANPAHLFAGYILKTISQEWLFSQQTHRWAAYSKNISLTQ